MDLPQEIEAFYVIPAVRRELARILVADGLTQRLVAHKLGVTDAAVSQYLSNKRGITIEYPPTVAATFRAAADAVKNATNERTVREALEAACAAVRDERVMCTLHKKHATVKDGCSDCYE
jgi:predicted transcriptional regulator